MYELHKILGFHDSKDSLCGLQVMTLHSLVRGKYYKADRVHPTKCHEGTEEYGYSCTLFNLGARWGWVVNGHAPSTLPPGMTCNHTGGWIGPRAGMHGCRKSFPHSHSIPAWPSQ